MPVSMLLPLHHCLPSTTSCPVVCASPSPTCARNSYAPRQSILLAGAGELSSGPKSGSHRRRNRNAFVCEVAVELDGGVASGQEGEGTVAPGSRIRVLGPLKVFHVPKRPEFELGGCEGEIKDVLKSWKGKPISANLPYKVQFSLDLDGKQVKFFAHLKDDEFEVIG